MFIDHHTGKDGNNKKHKTVKIRGCLDAEKLKIVQLHVASHLNRTT